MIHEAERFDRIQQKDLIEYSKKIQLTLTPTDFKGPTILIGYRRISVIANVEIKEKLFKGLKNGACYKRTSLIANVEIKENLFK